MKKHRHIFFLSVLSGLLTGFPAQASDQVQITEIMYDVSGSDTGREWVEITNEGTAALDVAGYKFFEANTNHGLSVISGNSLLPPGGSALIVEDATKFAADWPGFSGTLLKSSFSLSNTGETLALKDSTLTFVDSATYDSGMGAAGDGNSLARNGDTFVARTPTPGTFSQNSSSQADAQVTSDSQTSSQSAINNETASTTGDNANDSDPTATASATSLFSNVGSEALQVHIKTQSAVMAGGGSFFSGTAVDAKGGSITTARYIWNFGDGATAEGQSVFHTYEYPGKYAVLLTVGASPSEGIARTTVQATPAQVSLLAEQDGSVTLLNRSPTDITVGLWTISSGTSTFIIPQDTVVLGKQNVRFAPSVMHLFAGTSTFLLYPSGAPAATASTSAQTSQQRIIEEAALLQRPATTATTVPVAAAKTVVGPPSKPKVAAAIPAKNEEAAANLPAQSAAAAESLLAPAGGDSTPLWGSVVGLGALIVLGVAGVWYVRAQTPFTSIAESSATPELSANEFEIEGE